MVKERENFQKVAKVKIQARLQIDYWLPWKTAYEESGDDGDEDQGESLLSTSSSSSLSHLQKYQLTNIYIPFSNLTIFCDPLLYFIFWSAHRKKDPEVEAANSRERKNPNNGHSQPVVVVRDVDLCGIKIHTGEKFPHVI